MNEENVKLAKIKKSCKTGKLISTILCIVAIAGCVLSLIGGISILAMGRNFDNAVEQAIEDGTITTGSNNIGAVRAVNIDLGNVSSLHSDIPAIQEAIDDHPYSIMYGSYVLAVSLITVITAVMMKLISSVFALIEKEDTPFNDNVIKRVTIVMIVISGFLLMTSGAALGILSGLVTWAVHTILDYGKTLQIQSDETL